MAHLSGKEGAVLGCDRNEQWRYLFPLEDGVSTVRKDTMTDGFPMGGIKPFRSGKPKSQTMQIRAVDAFPLVAIVDADRFARRVNRLGELHCLRV